MKTNIKELLEQYEDMQRELKDKKESISKLQTQIDKLCENGYRVKDSVTGGAGGTEHFVVEGWPYPEYHRKLSILLLRKAGAEDLKIKLEIKLIEVERYINDIEDSRIRRIVSYRYIDRLSWHQVAQRMGKHHTADSCRVTVDRYLKE